MQFYQTRSNAIALFNALLATCIRKSGIHEDWTRVILQSIPIFKVTTSRTHAKFAAWTSRSTRKLVARISKNLAERSTRRLVAVTLITQCNVYLTAVQKEDSDRKEMVTRLIQQFETHPNRDSLKEDSNKTEEFNPFSEKSKEVVTSMENTQIFSKI